ncbi:MAG: cytochrome c biogenesis protein ResB [Syntrophorhabdaceae bacterium]|nr:cytochrome c biogenesis protein ResB [Syntrophorhabdaceae bacterium]
MSVTKSSIYSFLSSLRLAIFLLSFIAITSIFGTVIAQRAGVEDYLSVYSESTYKIISFFGLDDVYHSPWFIVAIILFSLNLALCTYGRLERLLKSDGEKEKLPDEDRLLSMENSFTLPHPTTDEIIDSIKSGYRVTYRGEEGALLEKGGISRYGVYMVHGSILLILIGSLIGLIFGYKGFMLLNVGETKGSISIRGGGSKQIPLGFSIACKDFNVSFYPTGEPKEYVSKLEIIENGKVVKQKEIRVNDPLSYKGVYIYQASYGSSPQFLLDVDGKKVSLKEGGRFTEGGVSFMVARYEPSVHDFGPGILIAYTEQGIQKTSWLLKNIEKMRQKEIGGVSIHLDDIKEGYYTGLEVTKDPGVWVVWSGFALILFGLYVNFFIYPRRLFIRKCPDKTIIAGIAFKNREGFKEEFEKLKKRLGYAS